MKSKRDNAQANRDYIVERLNKLESECDELSQQITLDEKKITKLNAEKKKAAD